MIFFKYKKQLFDFVFILLIASGISESLKYLVHAPRPKPLLPELTFEGGGLPSTHTTLAFSALFFYLFVCQRLISKKRRVGKRNYIMDAILAILAIGVGVFRIISKAHFVGDVVAGGIIGLSISLVFTYYDISIRKRR